MYRNLLPTNIFYKINKNFYFANINNRPPATCFSTNFALSQKRSWRKLGGGRPPLPPLAGATDCSRSKVNNGLLFFVKTTSRHLQYNVNITLSSLLGRWRRSKIRKFRSLCQDNFINTHPNKKPYAKPYILSYFPLFKKLHLCTVNLIQLYSPSRQFRAQTSREHTVWHIGTE